MSCAILGMGTAVPSQAVTQADALAVAKAICCKTEEQAALLPTLYRQTGIDQRYLVFDRAVLEDVLNGTTHTLNVFLPTVNEEDLGPTTSQRMQVYAEKALPLAVKAAARALDHSRIVAGGITHLVTVSCTGFGAPGIDIGLIKQIGLKPTVQRTHVGFMGCHGALNGLRVTHALTGADAKACVLLCAVELCSLHFFYGWDPKKIVANSLFADGAAAVIVVGGPTSPSNSWQLASTASCVFPESEYGMTWNIGDHGFEMTLSTKVPGLIGAHLRPWLEEWLGSQGLALGDVGSWAVHPGGPRVLTAVEQGLCLQPGALNVSRQVLAEFGNMSSPTVLFIIDRLRQCHAPRPCVCLAFGPGLTAEATLFR